MSGPAQHTPLPWEFAADSYGKVRHSRKACVYANVRGDGGDRLVTVAGRIENWDDASLIKLAVNNHAALVEVVEYVNRLLSSYETLSPAEASVLLDARAVLAACAPEGGKS